MYFHRRTNANTHNLAFYFTSPRIGKDSEPIQKRFIRGHLFVVDIIVVHSFFFSFCNSSAYHFILSLFAIGKRLTLFSLYFCCCCVVTRIEKLASDKILCRAEKNHCIFRFITKRFFVVSLSKSNSKKRKNVKNCC